MAFVLYIIVAGLLLVLWSRLVQSVPRAIAIALILLPLLFTSRAILTGRVYAPADLSFMAEPLSDYARDLGVEKPHNIALSDLHCQIIPWMQAVRHALSSGEWPLWNPFILCGDILAAAAQPAAYDPTQLVGFLLPLADAVTFGATMTFFFAAFFAWAFARELGMRDVAALVASAGFTFCGMMAFFVGWPLARAWSFLPLVLFTTRRVARHNDLRSTILLCLALVLTILAGHPESVLHIVAVGIAYGLFELVQVRRVKPVAAAIAAGGIALLLTAFYLMPFAEAAPQTLEHEIRTQLFAKTSWDDMAKAPLRRERMARTFIPHYGTEQVSQSGFDPLSARVGPAILILAVLGIALNARKRETWFFTILAFVCLGATFGSWPVAHTLHALPLFDIAINERLAFAAALAMSILGAMAVDRMPPRFALIVLALVLAQRSIEDGSTYPALRREAFFPRIPLIAKIPGDARMAGLWFALTPNNGAVYELEDARGYQAMTNKRLFETYPLWSVYQRAWFNRIEDLSRPFLSFLNIRYALSRGDAPDGWRVLARDRNTRLLENTRVLPRAFVPPRVQYESDGKRAIEAMKSVTDFGQLAWIEAPEYEPHVAPNGPGQVTLRKGGTAYDMDVQMQQPGWVVVSATAWKGWRAYIDGRRVEARFANHAFLAVHVPAGKHRVQLKYLPESFTRGRDITLITTALLGIAAVCYRTRPWLRFSSTSSSPSA